MEIDLQRLIVRHRHVAPMVSALLAGTNARVRIFDAGERVILDRQAGAADDSPVGRYPIRGEREVVGWVEGGRVGAAVAAVLSYACRREADKRSLSREALERYRELSMIYELADALGTATDLDGVVEAAIVQAGRIPGGGGGFIALHGVDPGSLRIAGSGALGAPGTEVGGGILEAVSANVPEIVNDVASDPRARGPERSLGSLIAVPLVVGGRPIGVLGAATPGSHEYRSGDLKVLVAIAGLVGPAIGQARALDAARRAAAG